MSEVLEVARRARTAAAALAPLPRGAKDAALHAMADALEARVDEVLAANAEDVAAARAAGTPEAQVDRLALTPDRVRAMADGLRHVAGLPDPVGEVVRGSTLPNGLELRQVRVPLGVVGIVYEARPNVTADAAGLCVKSGNAVLLRGSASAYRSNTVLVEVLAAAATGAGLPVDTRAARARHRPGSVTELMQARGLVDVLIPRGGAGLISAVVAGLAGAGHRDRRRQLHGLRRRRGRPRHGRRDRRRRQDHAAVGLQRRRDAARARGGRGGVPAARGEGPRGRAAARGRARRCPAGVRVPAGDEDWAAEYLSLDLAVGVVDSLEAATDHVRRWGSGHTEAIVTRSQSPRPAASSPGSTAPPSW